MDTGAVLDGLKAAGAVIVVGSALGTIAGSLTMLALARASKRREAAAREQQAELAGERTPETPVRTSSRQGRQRLPGWYTGATGDDLGRLDAMGYPDIPADWGLGPETLMSVGATYLTLGELDALKRLVPVRGEYRERVAERTVRAVYEWLASEGGEE